MVAEASPLCSSTVTPVGRLPPAGPRLTVRDSASSERLSSARASVMVRVAPATEPTAKVTGMVLTTLSADSMNEPLVGQ